MQVQTETIALNVNPIKQQQSGQQNEEGQAVVDEEDARKREEARIIEAFNYVMPQDLTNLDQVFDRALNFHYHSV